MEIQNSIADTMSELELGNEQTVEITYRALATFNVRAVTRCVSTLEGHDSAVLCSAFAPDSSTAVTGAGDNMVIVWDILTSTPRAFLKAHKNHVLAVSFSPDGARMASGSADKTVVVWCARTNEDEAGARREKEWETKSILKGHTDSVTSISWQPFHQNEGKCLQMVTGSRDNTARVWNVQTKRCVAILGGHRGPVTSVIWGGQRCIYTASRDRSIKLWDHTTFAQLRSIQDHAHWVNTLAVNTSLVLRRGCFDARGKPLYSDDGATPAEVRRQALPLAQAAYHKACGASGEMLCAGSDDFTLTLIDPSTGKVQRMGGHHKPVNCVAFSPDGNFIVTASFDGNLKVWNGKTGKCLKTLKGHVGPVYLACWSSDGRLIASCSRDATAKIWNWRADRELVSDLPGHCDEVYTLDWSPDGVSVISGSKDKVVKVWRH